MHSLPLPMDSYDIKMGIQFEMMEFCITDIHIVVGIARHVLHFVSVYPTDCWPSILSGVINDMCIV